MHAGRHAGRQACRQASRKERRQARRSTATDPDFVLCSYGTRTSTRNSSRARGSVRYPYDCSSTAGTSLGHVIVPFRHRLYSVFPEYILNISDSDTNEPKVNFCTVCSDFSVKD